VFLCRHERVSVLTQTLFSNPLILLGIAVEVGLILLIVYTPPGNLMVGTAPLGWEVWLFTVPFAAVMLFGEEARKWMVRSRVWRR